MKRIHDLVAHIQNQLSDEYTDSTESNQYAWWLLEALTGLDRAHLIEQSALKLTAQQNKTLQDWLNKLVHKHMPLQYLMGSVPFNGVDILSNLPY